VLTEALPYLRLFAGKTVVIKYGGNAMTDETLKSQVMQDIALLHYVGIRPVLVHGGGPEISGLMKRMGHEPAFVGGLRVTDATTMDIVEMALTGKTNKSIVALLNQQGRPRRRPQRQGRQPARRTEESLAPRRPRVRRRSDQGERRPHSPASGQRVHPGALVGGYR
jgi:hypothetical protein